MHVWDRKFGTKLGELVPEDAIPGQVVDTVIWSQDRALLAIAYNRGSIRIFGVPTILGQGPSQTPEQTQVIAHSSRGKPPDKRSISSIGS